MATILEVKALFITIRRKQARGNAAWPRMREFPFSEWEKVFRCESDAYVFKT
jgi:hypothetical protein